MRAGAGVPGVAADRVGRAYIQGREVLCASLRVAGGCDAVKRPRRGRCSFRPVWRDAVAAARLSGWGSPRRQFFSVGGV